MLLTLIMIMSLMLSIIILSAGQVLSYKKIVDNEKPTPFECGFLTKDNLWTPFSMHFFLSALIFLIFDIELVLLFPYLMTSTYFMSITSMLMSFFFLALLMGGFILEWSQSYLEWSK